MLCYTIDIKLNKGIYTSTMNNISHIFCNTIIDIEKTILSITMILDIRSNNSNSFIPPFRSLVAMLEQFFKNTLIRLFQMHVLLYETAFQTDQSTPPIPGDIKTLQTQRLSIHVPLNTALEILSLSQTSTEVITISKIVYDKYFCTLNIVKYHYKNNKRSSLFCVTPNFYLSNIQGDTPHD